MRRKTLASLWLELSPEVRTRDYFEKRNCHDIAINFFLCLPGQAARYGVRENDKIVTINSKTPRNVDDAVAVIKQAGNQIKLVVLREEEVPDIQVEDSSSIGEADSTWASDALDIVSVQIPKPSSHFPPQPERPFINPLHEGLLSQIPGLLHTVVVLCVILVLFDHLCPLCVVVCFRLVCLLSEFHS